MPRRTIHDGQIGNYWLSRREGHIQWERTWYDATARQTRRASLAQEGVDVTDFEQAHLALATWFIGSKKEHNAAPASVLVSVLLARYYSEHASKTVNAKEARLSIQRFAEFWPELTVDQLTPAEQDRYVEKRLDGGVTTGTIARELVTLRAALRRAHKRQEIASVPFIKNPQTLAEKRSAKPKGRPLKLSELASLFEHAKSQRVRRLLMILTNTMCRPRAALQLSKAQVDFESGLVDLNPPGRVQNNKHRPIVPLTDALRVWLQGFEGDVYMAWGSRVTRDAGAIWMELRERAQLGGEVNGYSFRHTMARELRKRRVPGEQIKIMLGHQLPDQTTQIYAPYDPDYCAEAKAAIDAIMVELQGLVSFPIVGPSVVVTRKTADLRS